jgi:hypothetical protein
VEGLGAGIGLGCCQFLPILARIDNLKVDMDSLISFYRTFAIAHISSPDRFSII